MAHHSHLRVWGGGLGGGRPHLAEARVLRSDPSGQGRHQAYRDSLLSQPPGSPQSLSATAFLGPGCPAEGLSSVIAGKVTSARDPQNWQKPLPSPHSRSQGPPIRYQLGRGSQCLRFMMAGSCWVRGLPEPCMLWPRAGDRGSSIHLWCGGGTKGQTPPAPAHPEAVGFCSPFVWQ